MAAVLRTPLASRPERRRNYLEAKAAVLAPVQTHASAARHIGSTLRRLSALADEALRVGLAGNGAGRPACAGGRRRFRPRRDVSALRRRRAAAAAGRNVTRRGPGAVCKSRSVRDRLLGRRPGNRLQRAQHRRLPDGSSQGPHCADLAARVPAGGGRPRVVRRLPSTLFRRAGPEGLFHRQDPRDAAAAQQVRGHALLAGAELQGIARRPARSTGDSVGCQGGRPGRKLGRTRRQRAGHAVSKRASCGATCRCCH